LENSPENRTGMVAPAVFECQRALRMGETRLGCASLDPALYCSHDRAEKAEYAKGQRGSDHEWTV
jgi:hypothetical protein